MSNRDRAVEVLLDHQMEYISEAKTYDCRCDDLGTLDWMPTITEAAQHQVDALIAAGLIHVGQGFCTKVANCRLADGHAVGCERT